jgi:hypothetical protein
MLNSIVDCPKALLQSSEMGERLSQLEENLRVLSQLQRTNTVEILRNDKQAEWALRYGFFETIQIIIDIACQVGIGIATEES